ncbi:DNA polymerase III subunit gamma/tau [Agromyces salentinus]|uniref:DNA polymerase III subunit gamma/tau n=1 Tax=Agromyces salentinus TaxID=269421 RepID=A0ABN2MN59_9MICO|nr:DNA polymerase III subunit gamma/tau [Agromyces salentinus]
MTRDSDDDALRWEGDDDPTLAPGWKAVGQPVASSAAAERGGAEAARGTTDHDGDGRHAASAQVDADERETETGAQTGSVELVVLGILAGVYLLYAVGWFITALRTTSPGISVVGDAMYTLGLWLAVLAAPCWFALALRSRGRRIRLAWLIAGVVVLAPLPFVLGVTA